MEPSVIEVIITILGGGLLGMFGWFIRIVRADIQTLGTQLNTKIDKLDENINTKIDKLEKKVDNLAGELRSKINALEMGVAAIAATQAEHGIKLQHMMGHGERISAIEGATFGTAAT